jgi:hypothetical protein
VNQPRWQTFAEHYERWLDSVINAVVN